MIIPSNCANRVKAKLTKVKIDVESMNIGHGDNYINWIKLSKQKLKERERKLLIIKASTTESIINTTSSHNKYKISTKFIDSLLNNALFPIINKWRGISIWRTKKSLNTFKLIKLRDIDINTHAYVLEKTIF